MTCQLRFFLTKIMHCLEFCYAIIGLWALDEHLWWLPYDHCHSIFGFCFWSAIMIIASQFLAYALDLQLYNCDFYTIFKSLSSSLSSSHFGPSDIIRTCFASIMNFLTPVCGLNSSLWPQVGSHHSRTPRVSNFLFGLLVGPHHQITHWGLNNYQDISLAHTIR